MKLLMTRDDAYKNLTSKQVQKRPETTYNNSGKSSYANFKIGPDMNNTLFKKISSVWHVRKSDNDVAGAAGQARTSAPAEGRREGAEQSTARKEQNEDHIMMNTLIYCMHKMEQHT